jgi:hypothetical protein
MFTVVPASSPACRRQTLRWHDAALPELTPLAGRRNTVFFCLDFYAMEKYGPPPPLKRVKPKYSCACGVVALSDGCLLRPKFSGVPASILLQPVDTTSAPDVHLMFHDTILVVFWKSKFPLLFRQRLSTSRLICPRATVIAIARLQTSHRV